MLWPVSRPRYQTRPETGTSFERQNNIKEIEL